MAVNFSNNKFNLREKLKELERPSIENLVTKDKNGVYIDTISGSTKLESIDKTYYHQNVQDVFIYDTSKDSDGGAWRKRTQNTSWYNETLGTATRGTRREFPAVAVIIVHMDDVIIYDGDDPDLPMWMVFQSGDSGNAWENYYLGRSPSYSGFGPIIRAAAMLNATLVVGKDGNDVGNFVEAYTEIDFLSDDALHRDAGSASRMNRDISNRNGTAGSYYPDNTLGSLRDFDLQSVAMTVLPNAPVDIATGLPIPTVVVSTGGGSSVIHPDGVFDFNDALGSTRPVFNTVIRGGDIVHWNVNNGTLQQFFNALSATADSTAKVKYNYSVSGGHGTCENISAVLRRSGDGPFHLTTRNFKSIAAGAQSGVTIFEDGNQRYFVNNNHSIFDTRVAYITSEYNTGWMHGDIRGAFLISTDSRTVAGRELITNGTFDDHIGGWSLYNSVLSHQTDAIRVADNGSWSKAYQSFATEVGKTYSVKITIKTISGNAAFAYAGAQNPAQLGGNDTAIFSSVTSTGTYYGLFTATNATSYIEVTSDSTSYVEYSEISVKEAVQDRSLKDEAFYYAGIGPTQFPVANGADLVSFSGFSDSNYLRQPYHSGMDFGTGDMSVSFWMKIDGNISDTAYVYDRQGSNGNRHAIYLASGNSGSLFFYFFNPGGGVETFATNLNSHKDSWVSYTCNRSNSGLVEIYMNGQLRGSAILAVKDLTNANADTFIATRHTAQSSASQQSFALLKFSATIPTSEQIKQIYNDEMCLFQENAKALLYGSSNDITAVAFDEVTNNLHVGTSSGRSDFQGLRRINNTTTAVTTAISAHDGLIVEH